ncbi:unnamed protein product [Owenia fusiformis]|uniref:Uncharacterized protein n=1 Tax=Owenia fusiformis TaxID=6347 RepID=A0A8J1XQ86_OWEFU|nr:unnamed protein product [Owenia fusiformis]
MMVAVFAALTLLSAVVVSADRQPAYTPTHRYRVPSYGQDRYGELQKQNEFGYDDSVYHEDMYGEPNVNREHTDAETGGGYEDTIAYSYEDYKKGYAEYAPRELDSHFCGGKYNGNYANPGLSYDADPRCTYISCSNDRTFLFNCADGSWNGQGYRHHQPHSKESYHYKYQRYGYDFCHVQDRHASQVCRRGSLGYD